MQKQQAMADTGALVSTAVASVTWIAELNAVLQLVATLVAIIAGAGAAWWHFEKAITARRERKRQENAQ